MKTIQIKCPRCGFVQSIDAENPNRFCRNCGLKLQPAPQAPPQQSPPNQPEQKEYPLWLWIIGWVLIFPLPLKAILDRNDSIPKPLKTIINILSWVAYGIHCIFWSIIFISSVMSSIPSGNLKKQLVTVNETTIAVTTDIQTTTGPTTEPETTEEPTEKPTEKPTQRVTVPPTALPAEIIITYPTNINPGETANVSIDAAPNTSYSIDVEYKSGKSKAEGLLTKETDSSGYAEWSWEIGSGTSEGNITVTISGGGASRSVQIYVNP